MPLNVLAKFSILDIFGGSGYASEDVLKNEIFTTTLGSSKTGNSEKIMNIISKTSRASQSSYCQSYWFFTGESNFNEWAIRVPIEGMTTC